LPRTSPKITAGPSFARFSLRRSAESAGDPRRSWEEKIFTHWSQGRVSTCPRVELFDEYLVKVGPEATESIACDDRGITRRLGDPIGTLVVACGAVYPERDLCAREIDRSC